MNASEKNSFEEQWRDAFENAELPPDSGIWANIETHLADAERDKYKRKLYLFKLRVAAAVAFLVLTTGMWTFWQSMNGNTITIVPKSSIQNSTDHNNAVAKSSVQSRPHSTTSTQDSLHILSTQPSNTIARQIDSNPESQESRTPDMKSSDELVSSSLPIKESANTIGATNRADKVTKSSIATENNKKGRKQNKGEHPFTSDDSENNRTSIAKTSLPSNKSGSHKTKNAENNISQIASLSKTTPKKDRATEQYTDYTNNESNKAISNEVIVASTEQDNMVAIEPLSRLPIHTQMAKVKVKDIRWQLNQSFWDQLAAQDSTEKQKKSNPKSRWQLAANITPGSFNPNFNSGNYTYQSNTVGQSFSDNSTPLTASNNAKVSLKDLGSMTRSGTFYTTGLQTEFALSERFSIQSGLQYTYSSSQIDVTQYTTYSDKSTQPDFYELFSSSTTSVTNYAQAPMVKNNGIYRTALNTNEVQSLDNTYRYIGIPMKVIYRVIDRKVKASIGAGISTDFFLKSQISSSRDDVETLEFKRSQNSIYKNTALSGLLSIKLDYAIDGKYSIYIEPAYRKALTSATTSSTLSSFPGWWGIGTGLMYRF